MSISKTKRITIDRENNEQSRRLKRSVNKVRWSHALMQIFWTAGPVTTIGLIGGYYIGYGTMPSIQLLIYFVSFTVFSGIIGLIAKVVYDGTRGHLKEQTERDILTVTDTLSDLILVSRDYVVQGYEGEARQQEAALQLLRRVDLTPYGVTIAFTDMTGNREIGEIMGQIFTYRRIGLQTKVQELYSAHQSQIDEIATELAKSSPKAAKELKLWFKGGASGRLKYGVPREPLFLQRIMAAIENNNPFLMTFRDVEEMMILAFELINGREIPTLIFSYPGNWKYASVLDEMEKKRSRYRVAQARGGNRIRALASYLAESGFTATDELPEGLEMNELVKKISNVMDRLAIQSREMLRDKQIGTKELQKLSRVLKSSIELYKMAYDGYKESAKRRNELIKTREKWEKIIQNSGGSPGKVKVGSGKRGIRIKESVISLNDQQRLEVCKHLIWYFEKEDTKGDRNSLFSPAYDKGGMLARRLAIEIAVALEPHIHLSKPEIQRNINATKAIYMGNLSPDLSAVQKQEIGKQMAREVDNGLGLAAIRLADTLVHTYHVELNEEAIEFLHHHYKANLKVLRRVVNRKKTSEPSMPTLDDTPLSLKEPKAIWKKSLEEVRKTISKKYNH